MFVAWLLIPGTLALASKELWELAVITNELVSDLTFWTSLPLAQRAQRLLPVQDASGWFQFSCAESIRC